MKLTYENCKGDEFDNKVVIETNSEDIYDVMEDIVCLLKGAGYQESSIINGLQAILEQYEVDDEPSAN